MITVELKGRAEMSRTLRELGAQADRELGAALYAEGNAIMGASKREVPVDEGVLRASGFVATPVATRQGPEVSLGYAGGASKGYAIFVHEGTGPAVGRPRYWPPLKPLAEWAQRVLGDASIGRAIQRAIYNRGTKPKKFFEGPLKRRMNGMGVRLGRRLKAALERSNKVGP